MKMKLSEYRKTKDFRSKQLRRGHMIKNNLEEKECLTV